MNHKHKFKNVGGGCGMPVMPDYNPKICCDDDYECVCGEKFRVYTTMTGHRYLPEIIESEPMSEIKEKEQNAIAETLIENSLKNNK